MTAPIVVLGAGLAGITVIRELRKLDGQVPIILVTADDGAFYPKPMLSNALAAGKTPAQLSMTPRAALAAQLKADIRAQVRVTAIRPADKLVETDAGIIAYAKLVLAVGAQPIRLPLVGSGAAGVLSVNSLSDYALFRQQLEGRRSVAILGAGLIGCEFANDLRAVGIAVQVFDVAPQPLGRLLPAQAAAFFREKLEAAGVVFRLATNVGQIEKTDAGYRLVDQAGGEYQADLVLSAVGLKPETSLARAAGLTCNRGIVVDGGLATSKADIFAVGDCAEVGGLTLPFVMPIMQQARALAKTLAGTATDVGYPAMPVVVKTPACPTVVCPPPAGAQGQWREDATADGVRALFEDTERRLLGFALVGAACADKQALATAMPAWL
jgi:rubredoxin---NAD+ reductase